MNMLKSLLLGTAAGLVAVAGAQAADLPAKAKAVEYVKVCDAYGAGFYYIPGTDVCLKVGGAIRVDYYANYHSAYAPTYVGQGNLVGYNVGTANVSLNRFDDLATTRSRFIVDMDARSRTEYGTLRSYGRFYISNDSSYSAQGFGTGVGGARIAVTDLERAFVQFAGFTFGYVQSFYDYSNGLGTFVGTHVNSNRWATSLAYTASFGNGLSATIAAEDPSARRNDLSLANANATLTSSTVGPNSLTFSNGVASWAGISMPDVIGVLRVDQSWGSAQLSGVIHQLRSMSAFNGGTISYDTDYGYAIQGGITFNLDMIAKGDQWMIEAAYGDGATEFVGFSPSPYNAKAGLGLFKGYNGAVVDLADAYVTSTGIQTVKSWSIRSDFRHFWTPSLRSTLFGGYAGYDQPLPNSSVMTDFSTWQVGFNTTWSPVKNLDLGLEVVYTKIDPKNAGVTLAGSTGAYYVQDEVGIWAGMLRVQRNF
jgi:hypothetical protein